MLTWFLVLFVLANLAGLFFVLRTLPLRSEVKGDWLVVSFMLGRKKIIDIAGAEFQEVPDDVLRYMRKWHEGNVNLSARYRNSLTRKYCYSGRYKNRRTGEVYHLFISGKGRKVCLESNGQKYVVDIIG